MRGDAGVESEGGGRGERGEGTGGGGYLCCRRARGWLVSGRGWSVVAAS